MHHPVSCPQVMQSGGLCEKGGMLPMRAELAHLAACCPCVLNRVSPVTPALSVDENFHFLCLYSLSVARWQNRREKRESEVAEKKSKKLKEGVGCGDASVCAAPPGPGTALPRWVQRAGTLASPVSGPGEGTRWSCGWCPGWTVPGRHALCRCSRGTVRAAGACRANPRSRAFPPPDLGMLGLRAAGPCEGTARGRGPWPGLCVFGGYI